MLSLRVMNLRSLSKVLLVGGIAGAGGTGIWWLASGGPNAGSPAVYAAFSAWVFVVLSGLAMNKLATRTTR